MRHEPQLALNWAVVGQWPEKARYERCSEADAAKLLIAIQDRKYGGLSWLKKPLVGLDVAGGQKILDMLDAAKVPAPVALWIRRGDDEEWRLLLASPLYDKLGQREANLKMIRALGPLHLDWSFSPISLQTTRQPLVRELRKNYGKAGDVSGLRLGGQMIGDRWVDDAYVYRIRWACVLCGARQRCYTF